MRLDQRPTKAVVALALLLITYAPATEAAAATKGENRQAFGLLCNVVLAATKLQGKHKPSAAAKDAAVKAQHIALILSEPSAIAKMAAKTTTSGNQAAGDSEIPEKCQGSIKEQCQQAANYLKNLSPEEKKKLELAASPTSPLHNQINKTVKIMKTLADQAKDYLEEAEAYAGVKAALEEAIYGTGNTKSSLKLTGTGATREAHCGTNTKSGSSSKNSLAETLTCLCASDSTNSDTAACYSGSATQQQFDQQGRPLAAWGQIEGKCKTEGHHQAGDAATNLAAATTAIRQLLYQPKGNGGAIGYIGYVGSTGAAGNCDGVDTGGTGPCATFVSGANTIQEPAWLGALDKAAPKKQELKGEQRTTLQAEIQLTNLNESITNLLQLNAMAIQQQTQKRPGAAAKAAKEAEDCSSITKKTGCQAKAECTWERTDKSEGDHCKLNATAVGQQATQAETNGATATTGCARHGNDKAKCEADKAGDKQNCAFRIKRVNQNPKKKCAEMEVFY
uniref:Variant surface glycoprotein 1125.4162 n=1 Tax=Trypanosoma brucei TaxID=5691 RepID=A0A1J0R9U3_9TRYP|nr:variant surface glycoprotein 1125.4162 [Trypanosoma brucei]